MSLQSNIPFIATLRLARPPNHLAPIPGRFFFSPVSDKCVNGPYIAKQVDHDEGENPTTMLLLPESYGDNWDVVNVEYVSPK